MRTARFLIVGMLLASSAGYAHFYTGNEMAEWMREYERFDRGDTTGDLTAVRAYLGFVAGVHDAWYGVYVCTPNGTTVGQASAIVSKWMHANPAEWNQPANILILKALVQVFPCKATKETGAPSLGHGVSRAAPASV